MANKKLSLIKKLIRVFVIISVLLVGSLIGFMSCVSMRDSDRAIEKNFNKKGVKVRIHHIKFEGTSIRYIESGLNEQEDPVMIFIHGAPGSSNAFDKFLQDKELLSSARLISVDRLGYGFSDYGNAEKSITRHARQIKFVVDQYPKSKKIVLVGHSFGGPIVAKVMMDFPDLVASGVMLAPAVDPENEKIVSVAYFTKWKATRWMFSGAIKVSSDEKFSHIAELKKMEVGWGKIRNPLIHVHGKKDGLVPYANLLYVKNRMSDTLLTCHSWDDANHLIIFNRYNKVKEIILETL